jgi:hypothetical protein
MAIPDYTTGEVIAPDLLAQFDLLEEVLSAAADDELAAAATAARDARLERVIIWTPDKARPMRARHAGLSVESAQARYAR